MQGQTLIQAQGLSRYYGSHCAVEHLDINLRQGEILGLLGPNGAGKSTTLQMLSGCLAPGSGEICICDIDLLESPRAAKQNIGYLPERRANSIQCPVILDEGRNSKAAASMADDWPQYGVATRLVKTTKCRELCLVLRNTLCGAVNGSVLSAPGIYYAQTSDLKLTPNIKQTSTENVIQSNQSECTYVVCS